MKNGSNIEVQGLRRDDENHACSCTQSIHTRFLKKRQRSLHENYLKGKKIVLIQTSVIDDSIRLIKEVEVLKLGGYFVTVLGWDRMGKPSMHARKPLRHKKVEDDYREITLRSKAPQGIGMLPFLLVWWCFEFFWLMKTEWDMIHTINFNSIIPSIIVGKLKNKPVIYEVLDTQTDQGVLPKIVRRIGIQIDKLFMRLADAIIIVDEMQIEEFNGIPNSNVIVVYDSPPDLFNEINVKHKRNEIFTIFYAATLYGVHRLNLDKIFEAINDIDDVKLVVAGYGDQVKKIEEWVRKMPTKLHFIGRLSYFESLERNILADLMFNLRSPARPTNKYICGCKMLEAMMCGKPILVSKGTSTAIKVSKAKCGMVVDPDNIKEIKRAIIMLKENRALCRKLGAHGRNAYESIYGWEIMKQRLLNLYSMILSKSQ